ncbi:hypothetical protein HY798_05265 [Candidatus Falkowbacteria bacterium]|nr:hypothetical protein [Candidatus Falkowbacteria bacterium]
MNNKIIITAAIILLLVVIGAGGWYFYTFGPACNAMRSIVGKYDDWRMERLAKGVEYGDNFLKQYRVAEARIKNNPGDAEAYADLGAAKTALKDYSGAEKAYSKALALDDHNVYILNSAANSYLTMKNYPLAEECYLKMLKIDPVYSPAYQGLVVLYNNYYARKRGDIEGVLKKGLENSPDDQNLLALLASYYLTISGEREKAIVVYGKMLLLRPDDALLKVEIKRLKAER